MSEDEKPDPAGLVMAPIGPPADGESAEAFAGMAYVNALIDLLPPEVSGADPERGPWDLEAELCRIGLLRPWKKVKA